MLTPIYHIMIKCLLGLIIVLISYKAVLSQGIDLSNLKVFEFESLNGIDESYNDFEALKEILSNARIVLLGEQTHGDGATFDAKVKLIKFLHREMGFEILAFESGLYENYKANQIWENSSYVNNPFEESVFSIWSDTKQLAKLFDYVKQKSESDHPLVIAGFDFQEGSYFREYYFQDVKEVFQQNNFHLVDSTIQIIEETFFGGIDYISDSEKDSIKFYSAVQAINAEFKQITSKDRHAQILHQAFNSFLAGIYWAVDIFKNRDYKVQNPRDLQMAQNLFFLSEFYPDKKIICWGASYHFANEIEKFQNTDLTRQYIVDMEKEQHNDEEDEKFDLDKALEGAVPMGRILKDKFKDQLYSIAFSSYDGAYGIVGDEVYTILTPPVGSIEHELHNAGYEFAFVEYSHADSGRFYSSALGNLPILAPWQDIFDGLFYIETSYPPEFSEYSELNLDNNFQKTSFQISGKVIDSKTGQGVPYVHIALENTSKGTVTNSEGFFEFNLSKEDSLHKVVFFSSVGYESKQITLEDPVLLKDSLVVRLVQETRMLNEIVISAMFLSAKDIVKKARKSIESNYYQNPYNQELFYRVQRQVNDSITFREEASIYVYDKTGYKPSNRSHKNFFGQILQFRNVTGNPNKNKWDGVGSLWLVFSHDLILDKDNILHRTSAYDLELTDITKYNNEEVYEISFICKRPSAYTTGYGHPAPKSSHGKLYIKVNDYSILKYVHCIERKPRRPKKSSKTKSENIYYRLIQTFKQFNGHYYLHHSKQVMSSDKINLESMERIHYTQSRDLLSTEIFTENVLPLEKPIIKIKVGMKVIKDKEFWNHHNIVLEDNYSDSTICDSHIEKLK